jgi:adenosylcobalamin-dependent ribonucleoside-triphosphate reductase
VPTTTIIKPTAKTYKNPVSKNGRKTIDDDFPFKLDPDFMAKFVGKKPKFGYNGLGEFVFYRTYSRLKEDGTKETFADMLQRVVEGCYEIQRVWCSKGKKDRKKNDEKSDNKSDEKKDENIAFGGMALPWTRPKAQKSAQEMFQRMWDFKFLPPGRGLWVMGTPHMWKLGSAALNNCGFCSTQSITEDPAWPFCFVMDMSMLGVGVGFDTRGANKISAVKPHDIETPWAIEDSREGWVDSLRALIESFTNRPELGIINFDYSEIRAAGSDIKGFGGKASGPATLHDLHKMVVHHFRNILRRKSQLITSVDIVDLMNFIGRCVVAGNVRRSSEIALGDPADWDYMTMKDKTMHSEQLMSHRWASNNSIFAQVGMDYHNVAKQIAENGEPGCLWLDNVQNYGRMIDGRQEGIDKRAIGTNPCGEQSLEDAELCCLCETFPAHHEDAADYHRTLKFAYLYAKTVTLLPTHCKKTNAVLLRNRRIGLSQSGIIQAFAKFGRRKVLTDFCSRGYEIVRQWDEIYSEWLCVSKSLKCTSVKPSGSVSLLAGATAGIHFTIASSRSYWRNVRVSSDSVLINAVLEAGYHVEKCITDDKTSIVRFGVSEPEIPSVSEISIWQQMKNAVDMQRYWADNQISCTIQFRPEEAKDLPYVLEEFDDELKGISFLPYLDHGFPQSPYQPATSAEVAAYNAKLKPLDFDKYFMEDAVGTKFCDGDTCQI